MKTLEEIFFPFSILTRLCQSKIKESTKMVSFWAFAEYYQFQNEPLNLNKEKDCVTY